MSACWFVAVACSDDEDRKPGAGDAGEGGDDGGGGKAGTPSTGGNMSQAGKAGAGGKAGSAGSGGEAGNGEAGSGVGGSGEAGSGGIVAGGGGEGGSPIGGGGEGGLGSGGEGGDAPVAVAKSCVDVCEDHDDCVNVDGFPKKCNEVTKVCETCAADADCVPQLSDWYVNDCETSADCDEYFGCVDFNGATYCAVLDDPDNGAGCADLGEYESAEATLHEGGADVSVCVKPLVRCFDGQCDLSCETFDTCPAAQGDTCNAVSGRCECQTSTECGDGRACVDNLCTECAIDDDCATNVFGHDKCVAGKCGCADVSTCSASPFPDATNACQ